MLIHETSLMKVNNLVIVSVAQSLFSTTKMFFNLDFETAVKFSLIHVFLRHKVERIFHFKLFEVGHLMKFFESRAIILRTFDNRLNFILYLTVIDFFDISFISFSIFKAFEVLIQLFVLVDGPFVNVVYDLISILFFNQSQFFDLLFQQDVRMPFFHCDFLCINVIRGQMHGHCDV